MAGFGRRSKPLKAGTAIADVSGVSLSSLADDDLLVYDSTTEAFLNTKTLGGSYVISGGLTAATLTTSGNVTFGGALSVAGNSSLSGTLTVGGTSTLQAASLASLSVSGASTLTGATTIVGGLTANAADFAQLVTMNLGLTVFGSTTLGAVSAASLDVSGTLDVDGAVVLGSNVGVVGDLSVIGSIATGGSFSAPQIGSTGTLTAGGATTLFSTLSVTGAATLASTLAVSGALTGLSAAFTSTVRSEGTLTVGTTAGVHQDIDTDETIWFNGATRLGEVGMTTGSVWYVHVGNPSENAIVATLNGAVDLYYNNSKVFETTSGGTKTTGAHQITGALDHEGSTAGFYNTTPTTKQTVTGSRGGNAALASLLTGLAAIGLITDSSSA